MTDFTGEQLVDAIRKADTLEELKAMVGATEQDHDEAIKRIEAIDNIYEQYNGRISEMPVITQERYKKLNDAQAAYETKYG